jgi:hypothetical protein
MCEIPLPHRSIFSHTAFLAHGLREFPLSQQSADALPRSKEGDTSDESKFKAKQHVQWNYGSGIGQGQIRESYTKKVTKTIKGSEVTRNASEQEPAYLVEQEDGDLVLKSESELTET